MKAKQNNWQMVMKYLRNPIVIFAIVEFSALMGLCYYLLISNR